MFSKEIIDAIVAAAKANNWPASALLAVVECETAGKPFEQDGRTPALLFERHKFYSELKSRQPSKLNKAIAAGLAIPKWDRATQYKDQGSSANRLKLIAKAREIDEDVANRAASWGLGQTMGFNADRLQYGTATKMVDELSKGIDQQIDAMCREIKTSKLDRHLIAKDFASFARGYNGPGYKQNNYDVRMSNAEIAWAKRLGNPEFKAKPGSAITTVYQTKLKDLNYPVGSVDGDWGDLTVGATSAFQQREGLKVTGYPDDETTARLEKATLARPVSDERKNATVEDLKKAGSKTVKAAQKGSTMTKILIGVGAAGGVGQSGALDKAKEAAAKVGLGKSILDTLGSLASGVAQFWWVGVIVLGFVMWRFYGDVIKARLADHVSGLNIGR